MVEIRDLVLRLPGVSRADARALADEITRRLCDTLPDWPSRAGLHLDLHLRIPAGTPRGDLARVVAEEIVRAVG